MSVGSAGSVFILGSAIQPLVSAARSASGGIDSVKPTTAARAVMAASTASSASSDARHVFSCSCRLPSLLKQVARLLIPHSKAEEQVVYPAINRLVPTGGSDVDDGLAEHQHVEETLKELLAANRRPLAWTDSSPR